MATPISHKEFEIRDLDRQALESKEGKSIEELLREGKEINENLLKEHELDILSEMKRKKDLGNKENLNSAGQEIDFENEVYPDDMTFDSKDRPEFDESGLSIDYDEED